VLLISVDGLRPDALTPAPAPTMIALACQGAHSLRAQTVTPPVTLPSHASMISGVEPDVHGLVWDDWRPGTIGAPTIFGAAHAAGLRTVMVVGKDKLEQLATPGTVDVFVLALDGDDDVAASAVEQMAAGFDLMLVHLPMVDLVGHASGWMSADYLKQVAMTDSAVKRILDAAPAGTTVIITADHGGKGFGHATEIREDFTIPWMISGPGVRAGQLIADPIVTVDTAATVMQVLRVQPPPAQIGRPVAQAFAP
jgi:predicted AlkP superfamily pyrophosphatase or phosphodiesterase